ncbi:MAG: hypothetical protein C4524_05805 [Candidatus Zixiibacteriota bacterium]|nr:MAG: hypothetical protein C4524_05805 [candidate division Zixibacteria bacterium]
MVTDQEVRESAAQTQPGPQVGIRPFPYPYRAALAICNDLDNLRSFAEMKAVHDVLNGRGSTPCGPGLGMEVGDSLHFFTVHPQQDDTLAYFQGLSNILADHAPALREGLQAGLLDILHTWGNYSQKGGFLRQQAVWATEEMQKYGLRLTVWTNHGDRHNFQRLGRDDSLGDVREVSSVRGDRSEVLEYHADLARAIGIRYLWIKELTPVMGQERFLNWQDWLDKGSDLGRIFMRGVLRQPPELKPKPLQIANHLIRPRRLRDGSRMYEMLRYGSFSRDGGAQLPELLSLRFLRRLVDVGGACLLYMHLGKDRPSPEVPFSRESYNALERLAEWARAGDIWVTTASRLCRYVELRQRLKLQTLRRESGLLITGEFDGVFDFPDPEVEGLTIYLPDYAALSPEAAPRLRLGGEEKELVRNPADAHGRASWTVPLDPVPYPWE